MSTLPRSPRLTRLAVALAAALAVAMTLALTACGGDGSDGKDDRGAGDAGRSGAFQVRIDHKYGSTEITKRPSRVVTLGLSDQDAVLALGVRPVGAVDWFKERPYGKWPWTRALWGGTQPEIVGERDDYKTEKIVALKPDLIIAQYSGMKKSQYDTLSKVAPVVAQPAGYADYAAPWKEMTQIIGRALGQEARAKEMVAAVDRRFAAARQRNPQLAGKTTAVVDPYKAGEYAVFGPTDPKVEFMRGLGLTVPDTIAKAAGKEQAAVIGSERLDLVDVDRLVFLSAVPDAEKIVKGDKVYGKLKVAAENRAVFVPYEPTGAAVSFNTVLSIPYAIDQMMPLLAKAG